MTAKALWTSAFAVALLIAGCQSHAKPTPATTHVAPILTSALTPAPRDTAERQEVIRRFTQDIWPAVTAYNRSPDQGNPGGPNLAYEQYLTIIDKSLTEGAWDRLRDAVQHLGVVRDFDDPQGGSARTGGLRLDDVRVTALNPPTVTLQACYTFTALSYQGRQPIRTPTAMESTFDLRKTDNWYLHSITNDHVVPVCPSSKA